MRILLSLTLSGSAMALVLLALRYVFLKRLPSTVYYYAWLLVLLRFVLPLPGLLPVEQAAREASRPVISSHLLQSEEKGMQPAALSLPEDFVSVTTVTSEAAPRRFRRRYREEIMLTSNPRHSGSLSGLWARRSASGFILQATCSSPPGCGAASAPQH